MSDIQNIGNCINCKTHSTGNFCHNCGQRKSVNRITIRTLIEDFSSKWLGWDNKFLRTIKRLTFQPGSVAHSYINGNRVTYVGPIGYTFLTTTIMILLYSWFNVDIGELIKSSQEAFGPAGTTAQTTNTKEFTNDLTSTMTENFRFMVMTMIPFLALSGLIFYSGASKKTNYLEQGVLFFYIAGHTIWLNILSMPLLKIFGFQYFWMISIFSYSYSIYGIYNFNEKKGVVGVIKAFFVYFVGFTIFIIFLFIVIAIYLVFFTDFIQTIKGSLPKG